MEEIYTVKQILEDLDFGCEERAKDAPVMAVVVLEAADGSLVERKAVDAELYRQDIRKGDRVRVDGDKWIKLS